MVEGKRFLKLNAFADSASHGLRLYFLDKVQLLSLMIGNVPEMKVGKFNLCNT